jgi:regulator of replication initiation timing
MLETTLDNGPDTRAQNTELRAANADQRAQLKQLRAENARLRAENRELRGALDAHVTRAAATAVFGPVEMSAGTCVGPRRRRTVGDEGGDC